MAIPRKTKTKKTARSTASKTKGKRKTKAVPPKQKATKPKAITKKKAKAKPGAKAKTKATGPEVKAKTKATGPGGRAKTKAKKAKATTQAKVPSRRKAKAPSAKAKSTPARVKTRKPAVDSEMQKQLREALISQRERLLVVVQSAQAQMAQKDGDLADVIDRASGGYENELAVGLMAIEAAQLDDIEAAIRRIDDGTYGLCFDCGKPIPRKRLEVLPFAQRCLVCKGNRERGVRTVGGFLNDED